MTNEGLNPLLLKAQACLQIGYFEGALRLCRELEHRKPDAILLR